MELTLKVIDVEGRKEELLLTSWSRGKGQQSKHLVVEIEPVAALLRSGELRQVGKLEGEKSVPADSLVNSSPQHPLLKSPFTLPSSLNCLQLTRVRATAAIAPI